MFLITRGNKHWAFWTTLALLILPIPAPAQHIAYIGTAIPNSAGNITVVDVEARTVVGNVPLPAWPLAISVSPDGRRVYALLPNQSAILIIDAATRSVAGRITLPKPNRISPQHMVVTPDGAFAYVSNGDNGFLEPGAVYGIDLATNEFVAEIHVDRARELALTSDGSTLYASGSDGIAIIDTQTNQRTGTIDFAAFGNVVAATDGLLYAAGCFLDNDSTVRLCIIDTSTNELIGTVPLSSGDPNDNGVTGAMAISPDGRTAYVTKQDLASLQATTLAVDLVDRRIRNRIPGGSDDRNLAFTPDGREALVVSTGGDTVSFIDTSTDQVAATIGVGNFPGVIAIGPVVDGPAPPTSTRRPTLSPTPTSTPTEVSVASIEVAATSGSQGDVITLTAILHTEGAAIVAVQNDVTFTADTLQPLQCRVNPDLGKELSQFVFSTRRVRAIIVGQDLVSLADGALLYTCTARILGATAPGATYPLQVSNVIGADASGGRLDLSGIGGHFSVFANPRSTPTPTPVPTATTTRRPASVCEPRFDAPRALAYVTNFQSNSVSVVDTECAGVIATIPLPAGVAPLSIILAPDARHAYVSVLTPAAAPQIVIIDTALGRAVATAEVAPEADPPQRVAHDLAVSPDGAALYVTGIDGTDLAMIDAAAHFPLGRIPLSPSLSRAANRIAVSTDGRRAYVTHGAETCGPRDCAGSVDVVDLDPASPTAHTVIGQLHSPGADPVGIALSPDGRLAYTTNTNNPGSTVTVIDIVEGTVVAQIRSSYGPEHIALSADGSIAYVSSGGSATVTVIDTVNATSVASIAVDSAGDLALSPDGASVYVVSQLSDSISRIDTATNAVADIISVGFGPNSIAIGNVHLQAPATPAIGDQTSNPAVRVADDGCALTGNASDPAWHWWLVALAFVAVRRGARLRRRAAASSQ